MIGGVVSRMLSVDVVVNDCFEELQFSVSREPFFFLQVLLLSTKSITTVTESLDC